MTEKLNKGPAETPPEKNSTPAAQATPAKTDTTPATTTPDPAATPDAEPATEQAATTEEATGAAAAEKPAATTEKPAEAPATDTPAATVEKQPATTPAATVEKQPTGAAAAEKPAVEKATTEAPGTSEPAPILSKEPAPAGGPAPETIRAIPVRHYGRYVSGVLVLAALVWLINAFAGGNVNWGTVGSYITEGDIVAGMGRTLMISVISMAIGLVLGVVLAVMRMSKNPVTGAVSWLFIWVFRGTPVYVQLLLWYSLALIFPIFEIPFIYKDEMTDVMTPLVVALLGLGLNEGAYMAEIVRAGIQSVDEGQTEASHALGMTSFQTMRRVVLPQAMRVIIPPTGNEFINMLKTSSLVAVVSYPDLLRSAQIVSGRTYAVMEMLFVASFWYLALTSVFSVGQFYLERKYARGALRELPKTPWQKVKANLSTLRRPEVAR